MGSDLSTLVSYNGSISIVCSNNDYLIVEGTEENFEGDAEKEILEVSGVKFNYEWNYIGIEYSVLREEGGGITGNGH